MLALKQVRLRPPPQPGQRHTALLALNDNGRPQMVGPPTKNQTGGEKKESRDDGRCCLQGSAWGSVGYVVACSNAKQRLSEAGAEKQVPELSVSTDCFHCKHTLAQYYMPPLTQLIPSTCAVSVCMELGWLSRQARAEASSQSMPSHSNQRRGRGGYRLANK